MRLFGKVSGTIDRLDRAGWITAPFDLASDDTSNYGYGEIDTLMRASPAINTMVSVSPSIKTHLEI